MRKPASSLTAEAVFAYCRAQLAVFKVPRYVEFLDELPRTGTNKIQKAVLIDSADPARWVDRYRNEGRMP